MSNHNYNITIISTNELSNKKKKECKFTLEANKKNFIEIDKKINTNNFEITFNVENADNVSQPKKRKYQQNNKSGTIAKRSKTVNFKESQLVLVEWKGSPHWPAIINNILGNVANVTFYGTHDT